MTNRLILLAFLPAALLLLLDRILDLPALRRKRAQEGRNEDSFLRFLPGFLACLLAAAAWVFCLALGAGLTDLVLPLLLLLCLSLAGRKGEAT